MMQEKKCAMFNVLFFIIILTSGTRTRFTSPEEFDIFVLPAALPGIGRLLYVTPGKTS